MSNESLRFGVVGLGMGVQHCRDLVDAEGCELVAICDANEARLETNRQEFGARAYNAYEEFLADADVDVVNICTPSGTHADLSVKALQAGKHVICEKPPDVTLEAVDRMIAAKEAAGKHLMVIFQSRFEPLYVEIRNAIQSGRLGRLVGVHGEVNWWRSDEYYGPPGGWKGTWKLDGGGSLANQGIHTLDIVQWLGGQVVEVYGKYGVFAHNIESEDKTVAVLTFANGALGTMTTTTAAYPGLSRTLLVHGSKGSITVEDDELTAWKIAGETKDAEKEEEAAMLARFGPKGPRDATIASDPFAFATRGHLKQFEAFAAAVLAGNEPTNSIETTRHTIEIMTAIYASARQGQPVKLG